MRPSRTSYLKNWREEKRKLGLCLTCGVNKCEDGSITKCGECKSRQSDKKRKLYNKRKRNSECTKCGNPATIGRKCEECSTKDLEYKKSNNLKRKIEALNAYGGCKCACCGEKYIEFLTLDHINNDGKSHRSSLKTWESTGTAFYAYLKRQNYPSGFQVLCWNCNWSKQIHKTSCAHQLGLVIV